MSLQGKNILITGAAYRLGRVFALAVAKSGANVIIHHGHSPELAAQTMSEVIALGVRACTIQADLQYSKEIDNLMDQALAFGPLYGLVNNAAIFESRNAADTDLDSWNRHLSINLTAPFLLSQYFSRTINEHQSGKIINILDWRALRPRSDHFPYTISKAGLAAMTKSLALTYAPNIQVNGIALGAILPSGDSPPTIRIIEQVPAKRWAEMSEVEDILLFLLDGPSYITGEIIHLDGGRHLV